MMEERLRPRFIILGEPIGPAFETPTLKLLGEAWKTTELTEKIGNLALYTTANASTIFVAIPVEGAFTANPDGSITLNPAAFPEGILD